MPRPGGSGITGAPSYTSLLEDTITDALNTGITDVFQATHLLSAGIAGVGMGVAWNFQLEDTAGNTDQAGQVAVVWEDPTSGSEDSAFVVNLRIGGGAINEVLRASPTAGLQMLVSDAATVTSTDALRLDHLTSGAAGVAYGVGILFRGEDSAGNTDEMARIKAVWLDATSTSEDSEISFMLRTNGAALAEKARVSFAGDFLAGTGSSSQAAFSFLSDPNSGMVSFGADDFGFYAGGSIAGRYTASSTTYQVFAGSGIIDVAKFRRSLANSGIDVEGNRSQATTAEDVRIANLVSNRTAGQILSIENAGGTPTVLARFRWDGRLMFQAPNSAPVDADLNAGDITFYRNEAGNTLLARVKYADGVTMKLGTIALV